MTTWTIRAFGIVVSVETNDATLFSLLDEQLPRFPSALRNTAADVTYRVSAGGTSTDGVMVLRGRRTIAVTPDLARASEELVVDLQSTLARLAKDWTFVHAGVVAIDGRALLFPARSGAGKSTLVAALLRAGTVYGSDEFAVLDRDGRVHPYARRLAFRSGGRGVARVPAGELGGDIFADALPVGAVIFTEFRPEQALDLQPMPSGELMLRLLEHCLGARGRPAETLRALRALASAAPGFRGARGEADGVAAALIQRTRAGWAI